VLTQEVAYGSLLQERRRALHTQIVEALETLAGDRVAGVASGAKGLPARRQDLDQVERLAHHALRGEVWDKAVIYCQQAGARAFDRSAFREAVAAFEQALAALQHLPDSEATRAQAIDLRFDLRHALHLLGESGRSIEYLRQVESLAEALGDSRRLGQVARIPPWARATGP
jgi:predicted ATPase